MTREALVTAHLQHYAEGRRELARMEELLNSFPNETIEDTIEALNHADRWDEVRVQTGGVSDPTFLIACQFRQINLAHNHTAREELRQMAEETRRGLDVVKSCISRLTGKTRRVVELLYVFEKDWETVEETVGITRNAIRYHRKKAITEIANMTPYLAMALYGQVQGGQ